MMTIRRAAAFALSLVVCSCAHRPQWAGEMEGPVARPPALHERSRAELDAVRTANRAYWNAHPEFDPAVDAAAGDWVSHGPQNLSGVTYALLFDPADANKLWSGSSEALWRSGDRGATWTVVPELDGFFVTSLARDSQNANVMYAGTGLGDADARGMYRSLDRGATWSVLPSTLVMGSISTISADPAHAGTLLIGTARGIYRSTDSGATWTLVQGFSAGLALHENVAFSPNDSSRAIASVTIAASPVVTSFFYSSSDGGVSWHAATGIDGVGKNAAISAYAPSLPSRVYAITGTPGFLASVWRSDDGGQSFARISDTPNVVAGGVLASLWVSPSDPSHLMYGAALAYTSRDAGASLTKITLQYPNPYVSYPHLDVHGITNDPAYNGTSNKRVYMWTDGGVFRSDNYEAASPVWTALLRGHQSTQFYVIDVTAAGAIIGGMQDTGVEVQSAGSLDATHVSDGDTTTTFFDPVNPSRYYLGSFGSLYRSDDFFNPVVDARAGGRTYFETPAVVDPNTPSRIFVASSIVARVDISGSTPHVTTIRAADGVSIAAIAVQKGNSNVVWIVNHDGIIYRTANALSASPTWTEIHRESMYYPTRILIDPDDPNIVYISAVIPGLFKTTNGGATWSSANGVAPAQIDRVFDIERHPEHQQWLYAGTDAGLYASRDGGATWGLAKSGVPGRISVRDVMFRPGTQELYVSTYGRGIWSFDTSVSSKHRAARHQ